MLKILSWNIQYGKGVDGKIDLERIRDGVLQSLDADIICFQEVARFEPQTSRGADQMQILQDFFPDYEAFFGPAYDRAGGINGKRKQFGNMILSRIHIKQVIHHSLPSPADRDNCFMLRQASELQVLHKGFSFRLINTHLEYFSASQQLEQVRRLRELHQLSSEMNRRPGIDMPGTPFEQFKPPSGVIICGDFNFTPESQPYQEMLKPTSGGSFDLRDSWDVLHPDDQRIPTCGVHDHEQWEEGPHCRDYFFISTDLEERLNSISINLDTSASDHQPIALEISEE